jgi:hypothetical protein
MLATPILFVEALTPNAFVAVPPEPKLFVNPAAVPIVELPVDVSVVNDPAPPVIGPVPVMLFAL